MALLPLYKDGSLHWGSDSQAAGGGFNLSKLMEDYKGPTYLYDLNGIQLRYAELSAQLKGAQPFYAMKANSHNEILRLLAKRGAGADVVSLGEIKAALKAGFNAGKIVYSGVGKTRHEIAESLELGIFQLNVESVPELSRIAAIAKTKGKRAPIALRVNPNVDIKTHPYIATGLKENKFGVDLENIQEALNVVRANHDHLELVGISLHLGSQMQEFSGLQDSLKILRRLFADLRNEFPSSRRFDFGGGLGIHYEADLVSQESQELAQYAAIIHKELGDLGAELQTEPGRWLVGHSGILVGEVQYVKKTKEKTFAILDTGMNHLLRPALYGAEHRIIGLQENKERALQNYDIVGPICESADFIGKNRQLHGCTEGEKLAILDTGAYGNSMSSQYNLQPNAIELTLPAVN